MRLESRWMIPSAVLFLAALVLPTRALAQDDPRYVDWDDESSDIRSTVARVSYTSGDASISRGDDPDTWQDLDLNVPMSTGDRVWTGEDGRLELQLGGVGAVRLDARTDLTALDLQEDAKQFSLTAGTASFQVLSLGDTESFEVDTPNAAVTIERAGEYRIDVDEDGRTRVGVLRGRATVAAGGGEISLDAGEEMDIQGVDDPFYGVSGLSRRDRFDDWVAGREQRIERSRSYQYVSRDIPGCEDLDEFGSWVSIPRYGMVWTPAVVAAGWRPYYDGHWIWQDPWGWTWVGTEPWGWAPYHYGRWVFSSGRWYWVPVRAAVFRVAYAPALVAFVGGPGWPASIGSGYVGWFPLAPMDPFHPWYGARAVVVTQPHVTYVNRVHVTVVNRTTFVDGGFVRRNVVRDPSVVREVGRGPVVRGAIPLVPARGAMRVSSRAQSVDILRPVRPAKSVVVRRSPPPAPLHFERKAALIREGRGAPVTTAVQARVAGQEPREERSRVVVRSVTAQPGAMKLTPRGAGAQARPPRPVPPGQARRASPPPGKAKGASGGEAKSDDGKSGKALGKDQGKDQGKDKKDDGGLHPGGGRGRRG